jgi:hypothetical protein
LPLSGCVKLQALLQVESKSVNPRMQMVLLAQFLKNTRNNPFKS